MTDDLVAPLGAIASAGRNTETVDVFPLGLVPERERDYRYCGYDLAVVDRIAAAHDGPVLVKADGARTRLLKARTTASHGFRRARTA